MAQPFTLQPLLDLSHRNSESATRKLGELTRAQNSEQKKLETLLQFRKDYQEKFLAQSRNGMDSAGISNFQRFLGRLDEAVQQQRGVIEQATRSVQAGREALVEAQRSMKSFDTLAQRHAETQQLQIRRMEQKMQDEQAGQFAARNTSNE
ncbi:MAG: flagellar export protein FliJ [Betaproteobacteria bacterium]|nr:flagellar export protein FliJ [Betaproteobacteria bacterium]MDE1982185.1 flagellar export protein FliJ [Betaproteobacteria bacterium]MDE2132842.1 flagellar export protein FliJ [Betaproteobacteria bacterium]MDE2212429.1 flagellar export protein FliJ [Betaproteobacteria bacterium]MDE2625469.1 flagellar export protein FliJ [Betaproteobacteria bacterium]